MILGFKTMVDGKPTHFVQKILACRVEAYKDAFTPKIHSIRAGSRWKAGMTIHMATGVRTKKYFRFNGDGIGLDKCISVQTIEIQCSDTVQPDSFFVEVRIGKKTVPKHYTVKIDGKLIYVIDVKRLAINDGFSGLTAFCAWFNQDYKGQIIHWTDFKY